MKRLLASVLLLIPAGAGCSNADKPAPAASNQMSLAAAAMQPGAPSTPATRRNDPVYAYVDSARRDLSDGKATIINQVMRLSPDEAAKFWPIYHEYEEEMFALGDRRVEMTRQFLNRQLNRTFDDPAATTLTKEWFDVESERLKLLQRYHDRIAAELLPVRAVQFTQIEHRMGTIIDLVIASELPLVRSEPAHADAPSKRPG